MNVCTSKSLSQFIYGFRKTKDNFDSIKDALSFNIGPIFSRLVCRTSEETEENPGISIWGLAFTGNRATEAKYFPLHSNKSIEFFGPSHIKQIYPYHVIPFTGEIKVLQWEYKGTDNGFDLTEITMCGFGGESVLMQVFLFSLRITRQ